MYAIEYKYSVRPSLQKLFKPAHSIPRQEMQKRIQNELKMLIRDQEKYLKEGIDLQLRDKSVLSKWVCYMSFPEADSMYHNEKYEIDIELPLSYPLDPPKVQFVTRIFHPNVNYEDGVICFNILKKDEWTIPTTMYALMLGLQALVNGPNTDSPLNLDAGNLFREEDIIAYKSMVDYCYYENGVE